MLETALRFVFPVLILGLFFIVRPRMDRVLSKVNEQIAPRLLAPESVSTAACLFSQSSLSGLFPPLLGCKMTLTAFVTESGLNVEAMTGGWTIVRAHHSDIARVEVVPRGGADQWLRIHLTNGSQFMLGGPSVEELCKVIEANRVRHEYRT